MNLHGIVRGQITAVNPDTTVSVQVSAGTYTTDDDGKRVPDYLPAVEVPGQVQPVSFRDITQLDSLNIQGTRIAIYLYGRVDGLVRVTQKGGDLITVAAGQYRGVWLVAMISEQWPDWCKALCTLQDEDPS